MSKSKHLNMGRRAALAALAVACGFGFAPEAADAADPIKIGFGIAQTGGLAVNGKAALLAINIWKDDVNAKGGLMGRPVQLVVYDDQTNAGSVPGIYQKLISVDKVDLVIGGYGTNMLAPAMPVIIQNNKVFIGLLGLAVNSEFNYDRYFAMIPSGPNPKTAFTEGFFEVAAAQNPKPQTVAIAYADAEFSNNAAEGARENAKKHGMKIIYDKSYPPTTTDYTPIARAIQATNADLVVVGSYPPDTVGMIRAANEVGLKPKLFGGAMVGTQSTSIKTQLGPLLNGIVNYEFWLPAEKLKFPGVMEFLGKYQAKAPGEGVDTLGYYIAPYAYAQVQVLGQAVEATKSVDDKKIADYMRSNTFKTVLGDLRFGKGGEWAEPRVLQVQFQGVQGNGVEQFKDTTHQVILTPTTYKTGNVQYPYSDVKR
jgi:branched-chain amino acid transport system substrate-binding protein